MAEARDSARELAQSMSDTAEEYKKQLEDELTGKDKILAEQDSFRYSLRHNSHRTRMVYSKLAGEIHYLSQMVADIGHSMEQQKSGMRQTDAAMDQITGSLGTYQESAKQSLGRLEKLAAAVMANSGKLNKGQKPMGEISAGLSSTLGEIQNISASLDEQAENARNAHTAIKDMQEIARDSSAHMIEFTGRLVSIAGAVEDLEIATNMLGGLREDEATQRSRIVEWSPALATGIELIDHQHKMLCLYINTLYRATIQDAGVKEIADIVDLLKVYTATHFATEERYFDLSEYPDAESHKQIHASFVSKVIQVQKDLYTGKITVGNDLLKFLKDWLVNHIRGTDHEYASFLKAYLAKTKDK